MFPVASYADENGKIMGRIYEDKQNDRFYAYDEDTKLIFVALSFKEADYMLSNSAWCTA